MTIGHFGMQNMATFLPFFKFQVINRKELDFLCRLFDGVTSSARRFPDF